MFKREKASCVKPKEIVTSSYVVSLGLVGYEFLFTHIYLCICLAEEREHTMAWIWESEDSVWEQVFSSYYMRSRI